MKKRLIDVHSALTAVLMMSTVMLVTIGISQSSVFAQNSTSTPTQNSAPITPAQPSGGGDEESSSDDSNDESSNSSGSDESDSQQDTSSSEDDDETEDDFEQTNPLLEQIRNRVYGALSSAGIPAP